MADSEKTEGPLDPIKELASKIQVEIKKNRNKIDEDWLRLLYSEYSNRFQLDNGRIWDTGKILIPFSLIGLGVLTKITDPCSTIKFALALASIAVIVCWLISAENHRAFQNKSIAWLMAIENEVGINFDIPAKLPDDDINKFLCKKGAVKWSIRVLVGLIVLSWLVIL